MDGFRAEEVEQARARLDQLIEGPREQEIEAARGRLDAAIAEQKQAQQQFDRTITLRQTDAIPQSELDNATEFLKTATAMFGVRTQELALLEAGTRPTEIRQAQAVLEEALAAQTMAETGYQPVEVERARAARDAARVSVEAVDAQMEELVVRSPCQGFVETLNLQPGDLVAAGAPVVSLVSNERLWIRVYLPQNRLGIQVGDRLPVTVDSYPDQRFVGQVVYIARQAEFTPKNVQTTSERSKQVFRAKVLLDESIGQLRPGTSASVWLQPLADSQSEAETNDEDA